MKHQEENVAFDLCHGLTQRFQSSDVKVEIEGAGVHWKCIVHRTQWMCAIACFWIKGRGKDSDKSEYYIDFYRESVEVAQARISSKEQTIRSVADWVAGCPLSELYQKYAFIDESKRSLLKLQADLVKLEPTLESNERVQLQLEHKIADIYYLKLYSSSRSCKFVTLRRQPLVSARCFWDDCELFIFEVEDTAQLAHVLKRWVCDSSAQSVMREEFPWLYIGDLADYYERGQPIEGEFLQSWDDIEQFYDRSSILTFLPEISSFIETMRDKGYDKTLRAGTSMDQLVLSRSRRHGMRTEQASILFRFHRNGLWAPRKIENIQKESRIAQSVWEASYG